MSYSFRKLRINKRFESAPCAWCAHALALGEEGAVCESCDSPHHLKCWFDKNGCGNEGCINHPLPEVTMPPALPEEVIPSTSMRCPGCNKLIAANSRVCIICNTILRPAGSGGEIYPRGERITVPEAKTALVYGILAFLCCPPILGYQAFKNANVAIDMIDANPEYQGRGMAVAGKVLGIVAIIVWVLGFLIQMAGTR
jgi:hypothetical protein